MDPTSLNGNGAPPQAAPVVAPAASAPPVQAPITQSAAPQSPAQPAYQQPVSTPSAAPVQSQAPADPILAAVAAQGYDVSQFQSGEQYLKAMNSYVEKNREYAELGQYVAPQYDAFEKWRQQQGQQPAAPQPINPPAQIAAAQAQPEPDFQWDMPKFDPKWGEVLTMDEETGQFVGKWGFVPRETIEAANGYLRKRQEYSRRIVDEFPDMVKRVAKSQEKDYEALIDKRVEAQLNALRQAAQEEVAAREEDHYVRAHLGELFTLDPSGQIARDPITGALATTQKGHAFARYIEPLRQLPFEQRSQRLASLGFRSTQDYAESMWARDQWMATQQAQQANQPPAQPGAPGQQPQVPAQVRQQPPQTGGFSMAPSAQTFLQQAQSQLPPGAGNIPGRDGAHAHGVNGRRFDLDSELGALMDEQMRRTGLLPANFQ